MTRKVGAIDLGSNSLRLVVAQVNEKGRLQLLRSELKETRLGEKLRRGGPLYPPARMRTLEALSPLLKIMVEEEVEAGIVVATSAAREAVDGTAFLRDVEKKSPYPVRLLSEREEAYYGFWGALNDTADTVNHNEKFLVLDLGGRSSESGWQKKGKFNYVSFPFGAVSLKEAFFSAESCGPEQGIEELRAYLKQTLRLEKELTEAAYSRECIGLGGTITTVGALADKLKTFTSGCVHGRRLKKDEIDAILQKLLCSTPPERRELLPFAPMRADIITAGVAALSAFLEYLGKDTLYVSEQGLLHGVLREL